MCHVTASLRIVFSGKGVFEQSCYRCNYMQLASMEASTTQLIFQILMERCTELSALAGSGTSPSSKPCRKIWRFKVCRCCWIRSRKRHLFNINIEYIYIIEYNNIMESWFTAYHLWISRNLPWNSNCFAACFADTLFKSTSMRSSCFTWTCLLLPTFADKANTETPRTNTWRNRDVFDVFLKP